MSPAGAGESLYKITRRGVSPKDSYGEWPNVHRTPSESKPGPKDSYGESLYTRKVRRTPMRGIAGSMRKFIMESPI